MPVNLRNQIIGLLRPYTEQMQLGCGHLVPEPEDCKAAQVSDESYFCRKCDKNERKIYSKDFGQNKYPKEVIYRLYKTALHAADDDQLVLKIGKILSRSDIKGFPETIRKRFASIFAMNKPTLHKPIAVKPSAPFELPAPVKMQVEKILVEPQNCDLLSFCVVKEKNQIHFELTVLADSELAKKLRSDGIRFEVIETMGFYDSSDIKMFKKIWRNIHGMIGFSEANQISTLVSPYLTQKEIPPLPPAWKPVSFVPLQEMTEPPETYWMKDPANQTSEVLVLGRGQSTFKLFGVYADLKSNRIQGVLDADSKLDVSKNFKELMLLWKRFKDLRVLDQAEMDKIEGHINELSALDSEIDLTCRESLTEGTHSKYGSLDQRPLIAMDEVGGEILAEFDSALPSEEDLDQMSAEEIGDLFNAIEMSNQPK